MQKFEKSEGNYRNAQFLNRKPLKIARYSCDIFGPNLAHFCNSEVDIYNRTQVINVFQKEKVAINKIK